MPYEENRPRAEAAHHIILEERAPQSPAWRRWRALTRTPLSCSPTGAPLIVRGEELHIEKLSLMAGDLKVEGTIDSLTYEDSGRDRAGGLFARLFR